MTLSLRESDAVSGLAKILYEFLPGSGNPRWKGHVSFKTVAARVGVADFWRPGSKLPMITALLERTLVERRHLFERLLLEVVRAGLVYRRKQAKPIKPDEIDLLNCFVLELGFKFAELLDPGFRGALGADMTTRAKQSVEKALREEQHRTTTLTEEVRQLDKLKAEFFALHGQLDRNGAGIALEQVLNRLFALHGLAPREPFRVVGEQIDGSFVLDYEVYLVEAKWEKDPLAEKSLLMFRGTIEGKSAYTRGVFFAMNGITEQAKEAITRGKQPTFFVVDGYDLTMVLSGHVTLKEFLQQRQRLLAEEGLVVVPYKQQWMGSRSP